MSDLKTRELLLEDVNIQWDNVSYAGIALMTKTQRKLNILDLQNIEETFHLEKEDIPTELNRKRKRFMNGFGFKLDDQNSSCKVDFSPYGNIIPEAENTVLTIPYWVLSDKGLYAMPLNDGMGMKSQSPEILLSAFLTGTFPKVRIFQDGKAVSINNRVTIPACRMFVLQEESLPKTSVFFPYSKDGFHQAVSQMFFSEKKMSLNLLTSDDLGNCVEDSLLFTIGRTNPHLQSGGITQLHLEWLDQLPSFIKNTGFISDVKTERRVSFPVMENACQLLTSEIQEILDGHLDEIKDYIGKDSSVPSDKKYGIYLMQAATNRSRTLFRLLSSVPSYQTGLGKDAELHLNWHGIKRVDLGFLWLRHYLAMSKNPIPLACLPLPY